jgi:AbrB family looped-hinge helix DNA binding protein
MTVRQLPTEAPATEVTRLSSRGQVVLPKAVRDRLGLIAGQPLAVEADGERVVLRPIPSDNGAAPTPPERESWRALRGCLRGTDALGELQREHRREIERGR